MQKIYIILLSLLCSLSASADKYRYIFIEAARQNSIGNIYYGDGKKNFTLAAELFKRAHKLRPDAPEVNFAMGYILSRFATLDPEFLYDRRLSYANLDSGYFYNQAVEYYKKAVAGEPKNSEYAAGLASLYINELELDKAIDTYEGIMKQKPEDSETLFYLIRLYSHQKRYTDLISALKRYEVLEGTTEELTMDLVNAYEAAHDSEGAYDALKGLIDAHPNDMNYRVRMGNWLMSNNRKQEAYDILTYVLEVEPDNARAQLSLMDYYRAEGKNDLADEILYKIITNPNTNSKYRTSLLYNFISNPYNTQNDSTRVINLFNRALELPQENNDIARMLVSYLEKQNAPKEDIIAGLERSLDITPEDVESRIKLISILWQDSISEKVVGECKKAVEYSPGSPELYYYLGIAQYYNEHYDDATTSFQKAAEYITKDTKYNMCGNIYQMLGDCYQKKSQLDAAFEAYDNSLKYDPDNITCLNNYAYYLSCANRDLEKAERMSYKVISVHATNATYLDTYAWVLFKLKRYEDARVYIELALENDTVVDDQDGELRDHAGDIYFKLGYKEKANQMWQEAAAMGVENIAALRKKIKTQKL